MMKIKSAVYCLVFVFTFTSGLMAAELSALDPDAHRRYATVFDRKMSYIEVGEGRPILFLHGQAEGAHSWRKVMPYLKEHGRVIAIDNIGQGASERLPDDYGPERYRFLDHYRYIEQLMRQLDVVEDVVLVGTDWGASLAFHYAAQNPSKIRGLVFMEAMIRPYRRQDWVGEPLERFFDFTRDAERLRDMYIDDYQEKMARFWKNEGAGPDAFEQFMKYYGGEPSRRYALLQWPPEVPIDGHPADNHQAFETCFEWLQLSKTPKLLIKVNPGAMVQIRDMETIIEFPNIQIVEVDGYHVPFENSAHDVGAAIADWVEQLP